MSAINEENDCLLQYHILTFPAKENRTVFFTVFFKFVLNISDSSCSFHTISTSYIFK